MKSPGVAETAGVRVNWDATYDDRGARAADQWCGNRRCRTTAGSSAMDTMADGPVVEATEEAVLIIVMDRRTTRNLRRSQLYVNDFLSTS